ncbi:MAG: DUF1992 domain-containing protein [Bacillota bacterium]|nr:DUF1992 domain-containing protein [Bacillota bacterium]
MTKDYNLDEEIKKHPGFGKPLPKNLLKGDIYSNFLNTAKEAGYLPTWISLQKEIRESIALTLTLIEQNTIESKIVDSINEINEKIKKYNIQCPPNMQRGRISLESISKQYQFWE